MAAALVERRRGMPEGCLYLMRWPLGTLAALAVVLGSVLVFPQTP
jgi:hypothetical protein